MKSSVKFLFYLLVLFSLFVGGNFRILSPFTLRHVCTLVLLFLCFITKSRMTRVPLQRLYFFYLTVYCLANMANGEFGTPLFLRSLYTYHLPCVAIIFCFPRIIRTYRDVYIFTTAVIALYIADMIFTILQFYDTNLAWNVAYYISDSAEEGINAAEMYNTSEGSIYGHSIIMGLFGFVVTNGYFLATYLPAASFQVRTKGPTFFWGWAIIGVATLSIVLVQQRMAFYMLLLYLIYLIIYNTKASSKFALLFATFMLLLGFIDISSVDMGRIGNTEDATRMQIVQDFFSFLQSPDVIWGGAQHYHDVYQKYQHNTFAASWVYSGIPGFVVFVCLYYSLLKKSATYAYKLREMQSQYPLTLSYGLASIVFLLYSLTHTDGVHGGAPMFWVNYVVMNISYKYESIHNEKGNC